VHKKLLFVSFGSFSFADCFQTSLIEQFPHLSTELLHILGAIISGAQVSECLLSVSMSAANCCIVCAHSRLAGRSLQIVLLKRIGVWFYG
jgi:hypothetical protein